MIKGIAVCLIIPMKAQLHGIGLALNIYAFTGGIGVLLFFFVSGYGIYKGYGQNKPTMHYWMKRLVNVYFPCVFIQFVFGLINAAQEGHFDINGLLMSSFFGAWFIDVIMLQYLIFYITRKVSENNDNAMIVLNYVLSIVVAVVFYLRGLNPRWYNGLLLFPTGVLMACKEQQLLNLIQQRWRSIMVASTVLFITWGGVFARGKGVYFAIDICKFLAGICLCLFICTIHMRIQFSSKMMQYLGKRSLFFYLVHMNLLGICEKAGIEDKISIFYIVIVLTFVVVELF